MAPLLSAYLRNRKMRFVSCSNRHHGVAVPGVIRRWCYHTDSSYSHQVEFICNANKDRTISEDFRLPMNEHQDIDKYNSCGGLLSIPPGQEMISFVSAVESYSKRELSNPEDRMNAFQGIFHRYLDNMDGEKSSFHYGLPVSAFDQAFCWSAHKHNPKLRNTAFPSWSWLGWNDAVSFDRKVLGQDWTSQMFHGRTFHSGHKNVANYRETLKLRKSASDEDDGFGFPVAVAMQPHNIPQLLIFASVASLSISREPLKSNGSNNLYAIFYTQCSHRKSLHSAPLKLITVRELLQ